MGIGRDYHIDTPLSNLSVAFTNDDLIANMILPVVPVAHQSDKYFIFNKGDGFRIPDTRRSRKTVPQKTEFSVSSDSYFADNFALGEDIPWEDLANQDQGIDLDRTTTEDLNHKIRLDLENRVASLLTSTSNVGSSATLSGGDQWSDFANSSPIDDITEGKNSIHSTTGKEANLMVISRNVFETVKNHPDLVDRIKHTQLGITTEQLMAQVFGVKRILIGKAIKNTGEEGQSDSFSDVWGNDVLLAYVADRAGLRQASLGYMFRWTNPRLGTPFAVTRRREEARRVDVLELDYFQDEKITSSELGYLIKSAV